MKPTVLLIVILIVIAGCGPSRPKPQNYETALDSDTVTMLDISVTSQVSRQREWVEEVNSFLQVNVVFRNLTGKMLKLEVKTDFKDASGGMVEMPNQSWEPMIMDAHADYHYKKLCTNNKAMDYHVYVRTGDVDN